MKASCPFNFAPCPSILCSISTYFCYISTGTCITLPQFTPARCRRFRLANLNLKRRIYRFTTPPPSPPTDEITGANLIQFLKCPVLNLTVHVIAGLALRNPHEQEWAHAYFALNGLIKGITKRLLDSGRFNKLKEYSDYALIIDAFQQGIVSYDLKLGISITEFVSL